MDKHNLHAKLCAVAVAVLGALAMLLPWSRFSPQFATYAGRSVLAANLHKSVVINEIGWGGTAASAMDEWIELYNTTGVTVMLDGWHLNAVDGSPQITLSGHIEPGAAYLIERTDDTTISDVTADLVCPFGPGLSNAGESLTLSDADGTVVDTTNGDGGAWPNGTQGASPGFRSLERVTPWATDTDENWVSNDGVVVTGLDASGAPVTGTPASANSAYVPRINDTAELTIDAIGPTASNPGASIVYGLILRNLGGLAAQATQVTNTLSDGQHLLSYSSSYPVNATASSVTWLVGNLPPGATRQITLAVQISTSVLPGDLLESTAWTSTAISEIESGNNTSVWVTHVTSPTLMPDEPRVLISGVLYSGYQYRDADEAIELTNVGDSEVALAGWELCDWAGEALSCQLLPDIVIGPASHIWLAHSTTAFRASFGFAPDYELVRSPSLNDDGDGVVLRAPNGTVVDTLVYKDGNTSLPGWSGNALNPYLGLMGEAGQILTRITDESTGLPVADSDTELDWIQSPATSTIGHRVRYPGWDLTPLSFPLRTTEQATVLIGVAPDNAFDVVAATLQEARHAISIEVYSLRHPAIIEILVQKARAGVRVTALLEGDPVGIGAYSSEWQTQLYGCRELEAAGGACWFMVHDPDARRYQRYLYLHAKMLLVDDTWVAIGTQNLTVGGLPADDKSNGSFGSRGVVLATNAAEVVRRAAQIFALDFDPAHHQDLLRWNTGLDARYGLPDDTLVDLEEPDGISYTVAFTRPLTIEGAFEFEMLSAPEASLRRSDGLLGLLDRAGAGDVVLVEQLYETVAWGSEPITGSNPRLQAYVAAARRGARVRVLVNGRSFVDGLAVAEEGALTVAYLKSVARDEHLDLDATLGNPTGDGIHNKMVLVDLHTVGQYAHIGSINGSEASSKVNREVAVQLRSAEAFAYLSRMFYADWWRANPVFLPLLMRSYESPRPPAPYVVISEVAYTGSAEMEWIELHNPTPYPIDLSHYKLGDAETRESYEPMFGFIEGTSIGAGGTLVIAINGAQVPEANLEFYESTASIPNMVIYPGWGTSDYPLALRNAGDQVLLLGTDDLPVDVVVWGDATYPGIAPHPGVTMIGASLERHPPGADTDNCAEDFRERYPSTPGELPSE